MKSKTSARGSEASELAVGSITHGIKGYSIDETLASAATILNL